MRFTAAFQLDGHMTDLKTLLKIVTNASEQFIIDSEELATRHAFVVAAALLRFHCHVNELLVLAK